MDHDTHEIEPRLIVRELEPADYDAVAALQRKGFPDLEPWTREQFQSQLRTFNEGQMGIDLDGRLVAISASLIIDSDDLDDHHTFSEVSDKGFIRNHDEEGDSLYGIDIVVDPEFRGLRLARRLYDERKRLISDRNLRRMVIAGRMPGYQKHKADYTPEQYVKAVVRKEFEDPVITAQLSNNFVIVSVLKGYLPNDKESCTHAVLMQWLNTDYVPHEGRRAAPTVRVATVQYQMRTVANFEEFARQCEFFIDTASEYRSDFLLFPELLTTQLLALIHADRPGQGARMLNEYTERYVEFFQNMAIRYAVNVIGGSHLTVEDDVLYNVAYLFRRDGSVSRQHKLHITPAESRWWGVSPGHKLEVFETDCCKIAVLICYDIEFPELARIATAKGAQLIMVPYNTDIRSGHLRVRYCAQARCIENNIYIVTSGAVGNLPQVEGADIHYAESAILTPSDIAFSRDGVAAMATPNTETMLVHDLDLRILRRMRRRGSVRTWLDRRLDIYGVRYNEGDTEAWA